MGSVEKQRLFVRPFRDGDEECMVHIFRETADEVLRNAADPALNIASYIWCRPYFLLTPQTCFVVDNGVGQAVGYIIGTHDTRTFVNQWKKSFQPTLEPQGIPKPRPDDNTNWSENLPSALGLLAHSPDQLLHDNHPELLEKYPSHLHIDILPDYQGQGMGRILMETFMAELREKGSKGVHLGMNASNDGAMKFYQRMGFGRFEKVIDGGKSGESGRDGTTMYMVASL